VIDFDDVRVEDVSRHFGRRRALSRVTFTARRGTILGLLGPNGAGKSTLLGLLGTLLRPSQGQVRYGDRDAQADSVAIRARIGVLGHDLFLYPELTAFENLAFFAGLYGLRDPDVVARAALLRAGLSDRAADPVASLSRGMRQRVALERALIQSPRLVLLDEPFTGLDDRSAAALSARLMELRSGGGIVIVATHDLDLAEGLLDEALFLRDGRVVERRANPDGLRAAYRTIMTAPQTGGPGQR
jgi:heme exporter protein A